MSCSFSAFLRRRLRSRQPNPTPPNNTASATTITTSLHSSIIIILINPMKLRQAHTSQPNNDMIFGHRIGTRKIVANRQHRVVQHIRQLPRSKEENYFQESLKANEPYDHFLQKMNTYKIQQALLVTKKRFEVDQQFSNLLERVPQEHENDRKIKNELERYLDRYAYQKKGPAPRHRDFYYFI